MAGATASVPAHEAAGSKAGHGVTHGVAFHLGKLAKSSKVETPRSRVAALPHPSVAQQVGLAPATAAPQPPAIVANFNGIRMNDATCGNCSPPDPNAAVGNTQIVEVVNLHLQVYNKAGGQACGGVSMHTFFNEPATTAFADPRIVYDNVNNKFIVTISIVNTPVDADPILRAASSLTGDACGNWNPYFISGNGQLPRGSFIDQPAVGQDYNALLFAGQVMGGGAASFSVVFSLPKTCAYSGDPCNFKILRTTGYAAPVSNGGSPMINTGFSYFVASLVDIGYALYTMSDSGQFDVTLSPPIFLSSPFTAPKRDIKQPDGSTVERGEIPSRIKSTPINDGKNIWFTHGMDFKGFPSIRWGAINIATHAIKVGGAYHSSKSDDFNPSLTVGFNPSIADGPRTVFLSWMYTDAAAGLPITPAAGSIVVSDLATTSLYITGRDTSLTRNGGVAAGESRVGDYSSVAVDPTSAGGTCAVSAQEYFDDGGQWATLVSRFGAC